MVKKDPALLADFMQKSSITVTYFTPSQFSLLIEYATASLKQCQDLRIAFFAGERLPARVARAFYELGTPATLYNTWSPSELVVQTTIHETRYPETETVDIPIGYPLANCRHYITDACLNPLPNHLVGEICVGGAQVGGGYLNRPTANEMAFVDNPFCTQEDHAQGWNKLFRTGDRGRFRPDGQLEFHGRIAGDKQVKLRGYRIDLAEVEQRLYLEASKDHNNALVHISVVAREISVTQPVKTKGHAGKSTNSSGLTDDRGLVAFIVLREKLDSAQRQAFVTTLHERVTDHLNTYMLPNGYQFLDKLPITIGGKVDRQELLNGDLRLVFPSTTTPSAASNLQKNQVSHDKIKLQAITDVFREVLKLPQNTPIEPDDNFFKLGGQSVLLLRLQARLKRTFKTAFTLTDLFKAPTPVGVLEVIYDKLRPKRSDGSEAPNISTKIDWSQETSLPGDVRYEAPRSRWSVAVGQVFDVLLTGVDSFIGVHMLQTLLSAQIHMKVHVIGTSNKLEPAMLIEYLRKYNLFNRTITEEALRSRVCYIPGILSEPHFGLPNSEFRALGQNVNTIYHFGGQTSLLKGYTDLKPFNVTTVLDIIELAAQGISPTKIHHLSTWSVPHLQTWSNTKRTAPAIISSEAVPTHFLPPASDDFGYFKSRWVAEMLMTQASRRGFPVSIYRASAVTASTITGVPEPADDFIRRMVLGMVESKCVPEVGRTNLEFAIDFIPVDFLAATLYKLSINDNPIVSEGEPTIFHIGNPKPLLLSRLPSLMGQIREDGMAGRSTSLADWMDVVFKTANEDDRLRWAVLKDYLRIGHVMFALDHDGTDSAIAKLGEGRLSCPPVDGIFLKKMWENWHKSG